MRLLHPDSHPTCEDIRRRCLAPAPLGQHSSEVDSVSEAVGWADHQTCKNRLPYNLGLYCVGADVKPCSINQSMSEAMPRQVLTAQLIVDKHHAMVLANVTFKALAAI